MVINIKTAIMVRLSIVVVVIIIATTVIVAVVSIAVMAIIMSVKVSIVVLWVCVVVVVVRTALVIMVVRAAEGCGVTVQLLLQSVDVPLQQLLQRAGVAGGCVPLLLGQITQCFTT